jgi:hypothetical protein
VSYKVFTLNLSKKHAVSIFQVATPKHMTDSERNGDNLNGFKDMRTENGSSQGYNLALTGLYQPRF